jgi:N-acetylmuramoyl-L-alanine amidase
MIQKTLAHGKNDTDTNQHFDNAANHEDGGFAKSVLEHVVGMVWHCDSQRHSERAHALGKSDEQYAGKCEASSGNDQLKVIEHPSPNHASRNGDQIQSLILHYTAESEAVALQRLCDPNAQVSAHYLVGVDGTIYHLVDESEAAWHAGYSYWDGRSRLNSSSIGIEIVNLGNEPYPEAQMKAVEALCKDILQHNNDIPPSHVLGHSDIAVTSKNHKSDPGWYFNWKDLASKGIGVWPQPIQSDYDISRNWSDSELKQKLNEYGYSTEADLSTVVGAFQRHFQPEIFQTPNKIGIADAETRARLACLLRTRL